MRRCRSCSLVLLIRTMQVMFAKWDDILAIREVPESARGQCPFGGLPYATAVYHYARALALAAKAEGAAQRGAKEEAQRLKGLAETSLALLRVRLCFQACNSTGAQTSAVYAGFQRSGAAAWMLRGSGEAHI